MAIRAVGQNIEVTWSHSGSNENSNTISETTAVILQNVPKQFSNTFVSNCINFSRSSSGDMWVLMMRWRRWGERSHVWHCRCSLVHGMKQCPHLPWTQPGSQARHFCICAHCFFRWDASVAIYPRTCPFGPASVSLIQQCSEGMNACLRGMRAEWSEPERRLLLRGH